MRFTVSAPASSANLGPGFDALGLALDLWNEIEIDTDGPAGECRLTGTEAALLEGCENLSLTAMRELAATHHRDLPPFAMTVRTDVPVARGLGSSAAALVAGLVAADALLGLGLSRDALYAVALRMEGHGDNVGAAMYGGAVVAVPGAPAGVGTFHMPVSSLLADHFGAEPSLAAAYAVVLHVAVLAPVPLVWVVLAARSRWQVAPVPVRIS